MTRRPRFNPRSKTQKMVLEPFLLNTKHNKVGIKGKVEQSREKSGAPPYMCLMQRRTFCKKNCSAESVYDP